MVSLASGTQIPLQETGMHAITEEISHDILFYARLLTTKAVMKGT